MDYRTHIYKHTLFACFMNNLEKRKMGVIIIWTLAQLIQHIYAKFHSTQTCTH